MKNFIPDVIVEVTRACDRQCKGCYAPNILIGSAIPSDVLSQPGLFLDSALLDQKFSKLVKEYGNIAVTAIRGGEPSTHPNLPALIRVADKYSGKVYIETHGRWLDPAISTTHAEAILDTCRDTDATLKISFDRMHGLSSTRLRIILDHVESNRVRWCVAVTEDSIADACEFLAGVSWLTVDNIFLQIKAKRAADLVKPRMAVIASDGSISLTVSSRWQEHSDILETTV